MIDDIVLFITIMAYNDKHRQLLQYFMIQRIVSVEKAVKVHNVLFPEKNIENTIELINNKICSLEFKINKIISEQNGDISYVFVALFVDDFKDLKPDKKKIIFKEIVDYIIAAGGCVPSSALREFNSQMTDTLLDEYFTNKYLVADEHKHIYLSPLAISELEGYLADKFKEKRCMGCMSIVIHGVKCESCMQYAHGNCLNSYFNNVGYKKCPKCSKELGFEWNPIEVFNDLL